MTAANLLPPASSVARVQSTRRSLRPCRERFSPHESATLGALLERSFSELQVGASADCPVCRAPMRPLAGGGGECSGCGSQLS
jgi:hypothetical protein